MVDLLGRIEGERDGFTPSERALADAVLADPEGVLRLSIVELAARASVSPPTVTRFSRRLGCASFPAFKLGLARSRFPGERFLTPPPSPADVGAIIEVVSRGIAGAVAETFAALEVEALERAAESLAAARSVLALGSGGTSSMLASEFETRLFRLGLDVSSSPDHQIQLMRIASAPAGAVVAAFSLSGNNQALARNLAIAGECGLRRIAMTRPGSPVATKADVVLPLTWTENTDILRPTPGRYAALATLDVLAQSVATRLGQNAIASMRRIKRLLVRERDGEDGQPLGD